ncbi:MAG: DUF502 domain-containing protein [bacterium]
MWAKLSRTFFNGLIVLLPLFITIWLLWFLFSFIDGILGNIITLIMGHSFPGVGFAITIVMIFITGIFAPYVFGGRIIAWLEHLISKVPIIKNIYSSAKQVNEVFFLEKSKTEGTQRRACLIEYPRKGIYSVGFVTSQAAKEIEKKKGGKLVNVFIANTPTPATGFLVVLPAKDVLLLDMRMDEAFKYLVSAGVLKPAEKI